MCTKAKRIGETVIANCGMKMTIVEDFGCDNITIQFADGTIVKKKKYANFLKGMINNPTLRNYVGLTNLSNCGKWMKVIAQHGSKLDIEFEDGVIVSGYNISRFRKGYVRYPVVIDRLGETKVMNNGQEAKIENYRAYADIDVLFEDGTLVRGCSYDKFEHGSIANPNFRSSYGSLQEAIFMYYLQNAGFEKKPRGYFNKFSEDWGNKEIDMFNEELMVGIEYDGWYWHGNSVESDIYKDKLCEKSGIELFRIRESCNGKKLPVLNSGISCELVRDVNSVEEAEQVILFILSELNIRFDKTYSLDIDINRDIDKIRRFYRGKSKNRGVNRIGETSISAMGQKMTIIEYYAWNDVTVRFEDGTVVENRTYTQFVNGTIGNPNFYNSRIGEVNIATNGMKMKIIEYRSSSNITVQFEDGTIVENKSYGVFKSGKIGNPNVKRAWYKNCKAA